MRMRRLLALFALLTSALVVAPGAAANDTPCMGTITGGTRDNIVVPPGQTCILNGVTVLGNVKALEDSRLRIQLSNVRGNVLGEKADTVEIEMSTVRENIIIKEGGPAPLPIPSGFFAGCFVLGEPCEAVVTNTTVEEGGILIEKMQGSVFVQFSGLLSPIRGNVQVKENVGLFPEGVSVNNNTVAQNVQVEDNFLGPAPPATGNGTLRVSLNRVGQNLQVYKNKGPGNKFVNANRVQESLQCFDNDPPFLALGNFAREAQGQCTAAPLP